MFDKAIRRAVANGIPVPKNVFWYIVHYMKLFRDVGEVKIFEKLQNTYF